MHGRIHLWGAALLLFGLLSCGRSTVEPDKVNIRVINGSRFIYTNVVVWTPSDKHIYGSILSFGQSPYRSFTEAYRYAYISFKVLGKEYKIQPFDYVGETPLKPGRYAYKVTVSDTSKPSLTLEFIEE